ncbi:hypothetical protein ACOSQ2_028653 [Xanthoceras sorbifolium]
MDADVDQETNVSVVVNVNDQETKLNKVDLLEGISSNKEMMGEQGSFGEILTRVELDIACSSEKLVNLNILMMHVATRESDFEAFASEREHNLSDAAEKALEFDLLSGIVDSEVRELDKFMATLQADIINVREAISSYKHLGETSVEMEEQLLDSENSLKQSAEQISEIKLQSAQFQRTLSCLDGEENYEKSTGFSEDGQFFNMNTKIKMQTAEQQRHILRMLEKSLAREMDLEKKLTESRQIEEVLKVRLLSYEQDVFYMEEEATDACERRFEAENAAEVLMGSSKELLGRLQIVQFNLNGSIQRENALRSKLDGSMEQLEVKEHALQKLESSNLKLNDFLLAQTDGLKASLTEAEDNLILANSENFTLREKVSSLEKQLKESEFQLLDAKASAEGSQEQHNALCSVISELENLIEDLKVKLSNAESRTESAESKCELLADTNMELNEELGLLKSSCVSSEKVDSLDRQLRESDIQLQRAVAAAEASEEKQTLLYSTIKDMEHVIEGLKLKVSKADSQADCAEEKLIILSEANAGLNEELSFLRDRLECLEASLHEAEETKVATAKDIDIRAKVITNLVMQLAFERERLHQQIASLTLENRVMVVQLQQTKKDPSIVMSYDNRGSDKECLFPKHDLTTAPCATESKEEITVLSAPVPELDETQKNVSVGKTEAEPVDLTSELGTVRRIDAGLLNFKNIFMATLIVLISTAAYCLKKQNQLF